MYITYKIICVINGKYYIGSHKTDDLNEYVLLSVLNRLVEKGNTVVVIEHNLDVIKSADWILDMGPSGGRDGGNIVFCGTPEQLAECPDSATAPYLKDMLASPHN